MLKRAFGLFVIKLPVKKSSHKRRRGSFAKKLPPVVAKWLNRCTQFGITPPMLRLNHSNISVLHLRKEKCFLEHISYVTSVTVKQTGLKRSLAQNALHAISLELALLLKT